MATEQKQGGRNENGGNGAAIHKEATRTVARAFRSKPAQIVAIIVACAFMLSLLSTAAWWVFDTALDMRERLAESERKLKAAEEEQGKTKAQLQKKVDQVDKQDQELDEVMTATEDSTAIQDARLDLLAIEIEELKAEIAALRGETTMVDTLVAPLKDMEREARKKAAEEAPPKPRSDRVRADGVVQFKK